MNKVAIYCRVSTEEQKERHSIENQIEYAKEYCAKQGLLSHDYYLDNGISGTIPFKERPEGKRLIKDAENGQFKTVVVWKIDRLGRDTKNSLTIAHELKELGINITSMTEPFDTNTPMGEFMFTQLASFAKLERDTTIQRSLLGTNRVAKEGKWLGGIVPYGYKLDSNKYPVINENKLVDLDCSEAEVIRLIYKWVGEEKLSTYKTAERLNALNIPTHYTKDGREFKKPKQNIKTTEKDNYFLSNRRKTKTSNRWTPARIGNMVRNTMYKGIHEYGKRSNNTRNTIVRDVPAIVTKELWQKAQDTLQNNYTWGKQKPKKQYLLRGFIRCGKCGRTYIGYTNRNKTWYRCNGNSLHIEITSGERCRSKNINGEWIDNLVWNDIKWWMMNEKQIELLLQTKLEEFENHKDKYKNELAKLTKQLEKKEIEKQNILSLYRKGVIDMNDVEKQVNNINSEINGIYDLQKELKSKVEKNVPRKVLLNEIKDNMSKYKEMLNSDDISFEDKRIIIEALIKEININVNKGSKATVFVDTIPLRKNVKSPKLNKKILDTIDLRLNQSSNIKSPNIKENSLNIVYSIPIPSDEMANKMINGLNTRTWVHSPN